MSEQPWNGGGASNQREGVRPDGGWRDPDEDESESDGFRDDETSPDRDSQDQPRQGNQQPRDQRRGQDQPRQGNQPPRDQNRRRGQNQPRQGNQNQPPRDQNRRQGQNQPRQGNQQPQNQRRGQNQPRQGNQQPPRRQQPQRGPGGGSDGFSRRQMLIGGGGAAVAAVGGWFVFLRDSGGGPGGAVKSYYSALDSGNLEQAVSLIHEDSPRRGKGIIDFSQRLASSEVDISVDSIEPINPNISESERREFTNETVQELKILDVTVSYSGATVGQNGSETTNPVWTVVRNADGEWKLWRGE